MSGVEAKSVVERFAGEVLTGRGPASAADLISDPLLRQQVVALRSGFEDLEIAVEMLLAEDDLAAGHFVARGTHTGFFAGVPPTGRSWRAAWTGVFRVGDGRIAEAWVTWDKLALLEQLGAVERAATVSA